MSKPKFSSSEWNKIIELAESSAESYGLPQHRQKSVVIGTFNIRELGTVKGRSRQSWDFLEMIVKRFDLLHVQEVADNLEGMRELLRRAGNSFGMAVSDVTGVYPGTSGNAERLAFLFNWRRVKRTELASDITFDRSKVVSTLFENRAAFAKAWRKHAADLTEWEKKCEEAKAQGKRKPKKPKPELPMFLTFIRQPHCASFEIKAKNGKKPLGFLAVNAHLLYGENEDERKYEFDALIGWLTLRAKQSERMYYKNLLMMGDCNLEFEETDMKREEVDEYLKSLNSTVLKSKKAAKANLPLLTDHPEHGRLMTNVRQDQTYDQIAMFAHDKRFPDYTKNEKAGTMGKDAYDYGVFKFTDLFAVAIFGEDYEDLTKFDELTATDQKYIIKRCEWDVSDHMPAWFRLPIPGA